MVLLEFGPENNCKTGEDPRRIFIEVDLVGVADR